jgi:hypothetical protein
MQCLGVFINCYNKMIKQCTLWNKKTKDRSPFYKAIHYVGIRKIPNSQRS